MYGRHPVDFHRLAPLAHEEKMSGSADNPTKSAPTMLRESVVGHLRGLILGGEVRPGERIVEQRIAQRLKTSRGPVRDAIRALEHEGLVTVRPYAGASVVSPEPAEIDEIIEIRRQVEYFSIANATLRSSPELVDRLETIAEELGRAYDAGEAARVFDLDMNFHLAIAEASGHAMLVTLVRTLLPRLMLVWYPVTVQQRHTGASFEEAHLELVRPIAERDLESALAAIDQHIETFYVDVELRIVRQGHPTLAPIAARAAARPQMVQRARGLS